MVISGERGCVLVNHARAGWCIAGPRSGCRLETSGALSMADSSEQGTVHTPQSGAASYRGTPLPQADLHKVKVALVYLECIHGRETRSGLNVNVNALTGYYSKGFID